MRDTIENVHQQLAKVAGLYTCARSADRQMTSSAVVTAESKP
jgi:hypothetical protein